MNLLSKYQPSKAGYEAKLGTACSFVGLFDGALLEQALLHVQDALIVLNCPMGGYDQSPDYGGSPVTWRTRVAVGILFVLVAGSLGVAVWVLF